MSINLVPPKIKAQQQAQKIGSGIFYLFIAIFILAGVATASIYVANDFLHTEIIKVENKTDVANSSLKKYKELEANITSANKKITALSGSESGKVLWSNVITDLSNITPQKLQIKSLTLNSDTKKISLTGVADSRTDIALLKDNMESSNKFKNVTFTSSTLEQSSNDYTFNMTSELEEIK